MIGKLKFLFHLEIKKRHLFTSVYPWFLVPRPTSANVIQRQRFDFATTNLDSGEYVDVCVLNVTRAEGTDASVTPQAFTGTPPPPQIPANSLVNNPEGNKS